MLSAWRRYGENVLLGWDVGRCRLVSQWCYLCGYLCMEEMLDTPAPPKKTRQK